MSKEIRLNSIRGLYNMEQDRQGHSQTAKRW